MPAPCVQHQSMAASMQSHRISFGVQHSAVPRLTRRNQRNIAVTPRASGEDTDPSTSDKPAQRSDRGEDKGFNLEDINPYVMGRKSRALLDDVWTQFTKISSPVQSISLDEYDRMPDTSGSVFETPQAGSTTVLVAGATGRVGRVLVRKLLLRGYKVRALVRPESAPMANIPRSVEVVVGDVGDIAACRNALEGVDKVWCSQLHGQAFDTHNVSAGHLLHRCPHTSHSRPEPRGGDRCWQPGQGIPGTPLMQHVKRTFSFFCKPVP